MRWRPRQFVRNFIDPLPLLRRQSSRSPSPRRSPRETSILANWRRETQKKKRPRFRLFSSPRVLECEIIRIPGRQFASRSDPLVPRRVELRERPPLARREKSCPRNPSDASNSNTGRTSPSARCRVSHSTSSVGRLRASVSRAPVEHRRLRPSTSILMKLGCSGDRQSTRRASSPERRFVSHGCFRRLAVDKGRLVTRCRPIQLQLPRRVRHTLRLDRDVPPLHRRDHAAQIRHLPRLRLERDHVPVAPTHRRIQYVYAPLKHRRRPPCRPAAAART